MNTISGTYTTKRDGGIEYTYEADWTVFGTQASWSAKVLCDGKFAGRPNGRILNVVPDMPNQVRINVETAIEMRAGMK